MEPLAERNTVHRSSTRRGRFSRVLLIALVLPSLAGRAEADLMQITAPSINSASPDLLDHAASPAMAGVALDRRFEKAVDRSALTLNLTPLGSSGWPATVVEQSTIPDGRAGPSLASRWEDHCSSSTRCEPRTRATPPTT
jgi:hypothetical protein